MNLIKKIIALSLVCVLCSVYAYGQVAVTPSNPNALPAVKQVLNYLNDLPNRQDNRVISGQWSSVSDYDKYITSIYNSTGKWIALLGVDDLGYGSEASWQSPKLIEHWNNGGLISISYYVKNPWTGGEQCDLNIGDLSDLYTPGNSAYDNFRQELDKELYCLQSCRMQELWFCGVFFMR